MKKTIVRVSEPYLAVVFVTPSTPAAKWLNKAKNELTKKWLELGGEGQPEIKVEIRTADKTIPVWKGYFYIPGNSYEISLRN